MPLKTQRPSGDRMPVTGPESVFTVGVTGTPSAAVAIETATNARIRVIAGQFLAIPLFLLQGPGGCQLDEKHEYKNRRQAQQRHPQGVDAVGWGEPVAGDANQHGAAS